MKKNPNSTLVAVHILCGILIAMFAIFFSALAVQQHRAFQTNALDLGNVDQALWNTAHGRWLHFTLMAPLQSRLVLHVEPILWLFVPLYWLKLGGPEILLIFQATIVALGAWPLYQLALIELAPKSFQEWHGETAKAVSLLQKIILLIFPLAYLLLPTLEAAVLYDFHAVTLAPTFILYAYLALARRHDRNFIIFAILTMACKEDMPLLVALIGVYIGLSQRRWRLAGLTIGLSALWFCGAVFIIQPHFASGGNIHLSRYAWLGHSPLDKIQTMITRPQVIFDQVWVQADLPHYLFNLFLPTAFLGLFSPLTLLPIVPSLAVNLLSSNPFMWRLEDFHYGAPFAPFIIIATIHTLARLNKTLNITQDNRSATSLDVALLVKKHPLTPYSLLLTSYFLLLITSLTYHHYRGFTPLARPFNWPEISPHQQQLADLLTTIPADIPLFAQSNLAPHLTHRQIIYSDFAYFTDPTYPAPVPVEAILLDINSLKNRGGLHQFLRQTLLNSPRYQLITTKDGLLYFQTASNPRPPPPNPQPPTPTYRLPADFGQQIRLRGHTLHFNRQEEIQVTLEVEPLTPLKNVWPILYLLDAQGQPIGATTDLPPMLVWFPPETWSVGHVVQVRFNTLPWYTRQTPVYGLAVGFINGTDVWDINQRLRPAINQPTDLAPRLAAEGTLLELAHINQVWEMPNGGPRPRQFNMPSPTHGLEANFNQQIRLFGYDTPIFSANTFTITLYWQATATMPDSLTRFAQLIDSHNQLSSQNDSAPDNGHYPTYLWQVGEVVQETISLPLPTESNEKYTLHLGLYHPDNGQRLPLSFGRDHVEISID